MNKEVASYGANAIGVVCTAIQPDQLLQYVSLALTIVATLFSICFTIYNWYKKAKADGKITKDEVDDLYNQLNNKKEK